MLQEVCFLGLGIFFITLFFKKLYQHVVETNIYSVCWTGELKLYMWGMSVTWRCCGGDIIKIKIRIIKIARALILLSD